MIAQDNYHERDDGGGNENRAHAMSKGQPNLAQSAFIRPRVRRRGLELRCLKIRSVRRWDEPAIRERKVRDRQTSAIVPHGCAQNQLREYDDPGDDCETDE